MEDKLKSLLKEMAANDIRMTTQRRMIAKVFAYSEGFVVPKEVYSYISNYYPGVSYNTVYRNLRLFTEKGLIEQFNYIDGTRFKLKTGNKRISYYLLCLRCQSAYPFEVNVEEQKFEVPDNFYTVSQRLEVHGICEACRN